jgi:hypothetical protein
LRFTRSAAATWSLDGLPVIGMDTGVRWIMDWLLAVLHALMANNSPNRAVVTRRDAIIPDCSFHLRIKNTPDPSELYHIDNRSIVVAARKRILTPDLFLAPVLSITRTKWKI